MQLLRLPSGELRLTIVDNHRDTMRVETYTAVGGRYVSIGITAGQLEGAAGILLSQGQILEMLPHLEAFGETGKLEVRTDG